MDGTIVDSTAIVERAWGWWAQRHEIALQDVLHFSHGRPTAATMQHFLPGVDHSAELEEMKAWEEEAREGIVAVPGAIDAVREASKGPWAVVTSAPRRLAEIRIAVACFPAPKILVAVEDIERGKPDPEGFLKAANELGIPPADCLVFEDTGPGVEAGLRAGMQVAGLLTTVPREHLSTNLVIRDFRDVAITWRPEGFEVAITST
jgi:sugar-phosphatase